MIEEKFQALGGLPGVIPTFGNPTRFDRGVLRAVIALARGFNERGIDHLPGLGYLTAQGELLIEAGEQHTSTNAILQLQAENPDENEPIPNLIVDAIIGEGKEMLQNQHPEHKDEIEWLRPGVTLAGPLMYPDEIGPKRFEVDLGIESNQRIAQRRQLGGAVFDTKQSRVVLAKQERSLERWLMTVFFKQETAYVF